MPTELNRDQVRERLVEFDLQPLFIEDLGWDHGGENLEVDVDEQTYRLEAIAHKRGMVAYQQVAASSDDFPDYSTRQKIEKSVTKAVREHIIVYAPHDHSTQHWQWVKREPGQPDRTRSHIYNQEQSGESLIEKLERLVFSLDDEEDLGIVEVSGRVRAAFDVERVTKRFYDRFKTEHQNFLKFIEGILGMADREWYASIMLNRMMFIYFIQKRGFLDGDPDYLRKRLKDVQEQQGNGKFHGFYRLFLLRLFHEGLGQPETDRSPELVAMIGKVPYLNGGLFDVHDLERNNPQIEIPDEAFQRIFDFFDAYQWHLDDRLLRNDNEINPDVLGYIFEKYINQKQMGAYYTKEDITGYISRNTIIPFLFDEAKKHCPIAFTPGGGVWRLLQDDPDKYFYNAVRHGITYDVRNGVALDVKLELPSEIAAGLNDVSKRGNWNETAPKSHGLPTETWREHVARRERYEEIHAKLANGEITSINDLITYNLNIEQFAQDVISSSEGPELVRAFWTAVTGVSVLDPTCGSGAFLFAALNILEPIYSACLDAMHLFLEDQKVSKRKHHPESLNDFKKVQDRVDSHQNETYFILKSIIVENLYGVDIMEEAVEICKLRLFLKLVAQLKTYEQIEPLPDIDFNVRAGNTLVGFASLDEVKKALGGDLFKQSELPKIEERAVVANQAFRQFQKMQTEHDTDAGDLAQAKSVLRERLDGLRTELDGYLAGEYGVKTDNQEGYDQWRESHQPFHWFVEFYGIMQDGGFDVIIGNPPYVEYSRINRLYTIKNFSTERCGNLYAFSMERSFRVAVSQGGRFSFVTPLSLTAAQRMSILQDLLFSCNTVVWLSNFALRPASLFPGVMQRNTICITQTGQNCKCYTTDYITWYTEERPTLFDNLRYHDIGNLRQNYSIPKVSNHISHSAMSKVLSQRSPWVSWRQFKGPYVVYYHNAGGYWIKTFTFKPYYRSLTERGSGEPKTHSTISMLRMPKSKWSILYSAIMNSSLFYFTWKSLTDARHVYPSDIAIFPVNLETTAVSSSQLSFLVNQLMSEMQRNSKRIVYGKAEVDQYYMAPCKPIIDQIDRILAEHYHFTEQELDYIINYDIKYRMGL